MIFTNSCTWNFTVERERDDDWPDVPKRYSRTGIRFRPDRLHITLSQRPGGDSSPQLQRIAAAGGRVLKSGEISDNVLSESWSDFDLTHDAQVPRFVWDAVLHALEVVRSYQR